VNMCSCRFHLTFPHSSSYFTYSADLLVRFRGMRLLAAATRLNYSIVQEIDVTPSINYGSFSQYYNELNCSQPHCTFIIIAVSLSTDKQGFKYTLSLLALHLIRTFTKIED